MASSAPSAAATQSVAVIGGWPSLVLSLIRPDGGSTLDHTPAAGLTDTPAWLSITAMIGQGDAGTNVPGFSVRIGRRAFLSGAAVAAACTAMARTAAAQAPRRGGTLIVAADVSPPGLDPHKSAAAHSWMITEHVYSNLLRRDRDMQIVGDLAESWQAVNDTTYVFRLRKGVQWHHGRALSADDVKYSFERLLDEKTASPWRSIWQIVDRVEVVDPATVRFVNKRPFAPFISYLATPHYSAIVAKDFVDQHGDLQNNASGTGPFMLERFVP